VHAHLTKLRKKEKGRGKSWCSASNGETEAIEGSQKEAKVTLVQREMHAIICCINSHDFASRSHCTVTRLLLLHCCTQPASTCIRRVGHNYKYKPYMTVCLVFPLPKIPYIH